MQPPPTTAPVASPCKYGPRESHGCSSAHSQASQAGQPEQAAGAAALGEHVGSAACAGQASEGHAGHDSAGAGAHAKLGHAGHESEHRGHSGAAGHRETHAMVTSRSPPSALSHIRGARTAPLRIALSPNG